jgi:type II restriction enzyme
MNFEELRKLIKENSIKGINSFDASIELIQSQIFQLDKQALKPLIKEIGTIPEDIEHDSTEEKLYSKVGDILLAKAFYELGMKAEVIKERANCADVIGKSEIYEYSFVADAKAFRLSRTAKNQKDYKVTSMAEWKGDNDYAVLVCPFYQYPSTKSQIYGQALDDNVCLLSWEHLLFLLESDVKETNDINLSLIWNMSESISENITVKDKNLNFYDEYNKLICENLSLNYENLRECFSGCKTGIISRGENEVIFWEGRLEEVKSYNREQAVKELIIALKLNEKISKIKEFIEKLRD